MHGNMYTSGRNEAQNANQKGCSTMTINYSKFVNGDDAFTIQIVCNDGKLRMVTTERYTDGYHAFLTKEDGNKYTNHKGYKTARTARNNAAKW